MKIKLYTDMQFFNKCCCCAPLRLGVLIWAYLKLIFCVVVLGFCMLGLFLVSIPLGDNLALFLVVYFLTVILLSIDIFFSIVLIIGLHKRDAMRLLYYYRYGASCFVVVLTYFLLLCGFFVRISTNPEIEPYASQIITVIGVIITSILLFHCYVLFLINTEIQRLKGNAELIIENHAAEVILKMKPAGQV